MGDWWEHLKGAISYFGAFVAVGFGIYFFIKGDVTNGLLALILSCVAFNLSLQILFFQVVRGEVRYRIEKRKEVS